VPKVTRIRYGGLNAVNSSRQVLIFPKLYHKGNIILLVLQEHEIWSPSEQSEKEVLRETQRVQQPVQKQALCEPVSQFFSVSRVFL
jgi:hypothetical protein